MKEGKSTGGSTTTDEDDCLSHGGNVAPAEGLSLDPVVVRDTEVAAEEDTVVLDILTKRPALEVAQFEQDEKTATTRDWKEQHATQKTNPEENDEELANAREDLSQETSESGDEDIMEIVADRTSLAVAERMSAKEDLHREKPSTTDSENLLQLAVEINEAAKLEKFANGANNANTNDDDVPSNAQRAAIVREQQQDGSVLGNPVDATTAVDAPTAVDALPPPALQRTTQRRPQSQPGAFLDAPGGQMQRNPNLNYGLLGANTGNGSGPGDPRVGTGTAARMTSTNEGLVQANAVEDDTAELMHANPVDLETDQQRALEMKQQQTTFFAAVLWLLLVAAIIVGFVVGTQKNREPKVVVLESTVAPTAYGSMEPSEVPSSAPTRALDLLLDTLPYYTLASIKNGSETPQWKAWWWLTNHQNITFLPEWRKEQLFALATFFYAFEGENWNPLIKERWMDDTLDECLWYSGGFGYFVLTSYFEYESGVRGFPCNSQGQFTYLHLADLKLSGYSPSLPPEIVLLTSLSHVELSFSDISGSISPLLPTEIYEMTGLTTFILFANRFAGNIPSEILLCTSLATFVLGANELTGQIPSEISLLTSLSSLELLWNELTGHLPSELGLLTSLERLFLDQNQLTGPVPSEFGLLTSFQYLLLETNRFTGTVPSEFALLSSLKELYLYDNLLSGQIPSELWLLTSLDGLWLDRNQLSGPISSELGLMTSLRFLDLFENWLSGPLPSELGLLTILEELELSANQLSGTIPTEVGMMTSLTRLLLDNNNLTGTLPSQLNTSMGLRLYGNQFSGTVPEHLCSFLWCDCSLNETPPVSTCVNLKEALPHLPGRFPTTGADVLLNIHTDDYPEEISWVWQKETNVTGIWDTLESGGPMEYIYYLHSFLFPVNTDAVYRLIVSDSYGDGVWQPGWITLTAANQTVLYSLVAGGAFSEITIAVLVGSDGSFDVTNSTA